MTRLPESSSWEEDIELISRNERVAGGLDGPANRPLKSLANRTRYLKDQAEITDEAIAEKVSAVKTFAEGATLESPREEIVFGNYRLVWTGEFPKTVMAGSTPHGTGGLGVGRWAYTSDAIIRQNLGSSEGFKLVGQVSSAAELLSIPGRDGDNILLQSYYVNSSTGGGEFYYDSTVATINNGVTIFNGWRRKLKNNCITTHDAGMLGDNQEDAYQKFQKLLDATENGVTIEIIGAHQLSSVPLMKDRQGVRIISRGGSLSFEKYRDIIDFRTLEGLGYHGKYSENRGLGLICMARCSDILISGLKIYAAQVRCHNIANTNGVSMREFGSTGIDYAYCSNIRMTDCEIFNCWGWGIRGVASRFCSADNVTVDGTTMQSGINIFYDGSHNSVTNCKVRNCGLYGIENESSGSYDSDDKSGTYGNVAYGNVIDGAKWGMAHVGTVRQASATGNTIKNCYIGIAQVKCNIGENILSSGNVLQNNVVGIEASGSKNCLAAKNPIQVNYLPSYVMMDQYCAVADVISDTQYLSYNQPKMYGDTVMINGVVYTVVTQETVPVDVNFYGVANMRRITVDKSLTGVREGCLVFSPAPHGAWGCVSSLTYPGSSTDNENISFIDNPMSGNFEIGVFPRSVYSDTSQVRERFINNILSGASAASTPYRLALLNGMSPAIELRNNTASDNYGIYMPSVTGDARKCTPTDVIRFTGRETEAGKLFQAHSFIIPAGKIIIGMDVVMYDVSAIENVFAAIDTNAYIYNSVFTANASLQPVSVFKSRAATAVLQPSTTNGRHVIQLGTQTRTASCSGYEITIYLM